jgi:hypothetical protein
MKNLIGNQVETDYSNYAFKSREEAEAFYLAAREREANRQQQQAATPDVRRSSQQSAGSSSKSKQR